MTIDAFLNPWTGLWVMALFSAAFVTRRLRRPRAVLFSALHDLPVNLKGRWTPRRISSAVFLGLAIVLMGIAMARPVKYRRHPVERQTASLALVVDVSSSMRAEDLAPGRSRLAVAKSAATKFIRRRERDRMGLVRFSRFADLVSPLSDDRESLVTLLDSLQALEKDDEEDATAIGAAIVRAADLLSAVDAEDRALVILSDGAENVATDETPMEIAPLHAAQLCEALGIRCYAVSLGRVEKDSSGQAVPLDLSALETLATRTQGRLFRIADAASLEKAYFEIDALETRATPRPRTEVIDLAFPFIFGGLASLALAFIASITWARVRP